ncbi:MAG: glycosyltransferase family 2 protein, partial [Planctomycetota bacterium]
MGQKKPLISILLPTINRPKLLFERAIDSVLAQRYKNWQLIIIGDDCRPDVTKYIRRNLPKDKRISFYNLTPKVYHYPDTPMNNWLVGPTRALNRGLEDVKGDWIARLDDDDIWCPNCLRSLLRFAVDTGYDFVSANYVAVSNSIGKIVPPYKNPRVGGVQTWLYKGSLKRYKYN